MGGKNSTLNRQVLEKEKPNLRILKELNLSDFKITAIEADTFDGLSHLQVLDLSINLITSVEASYFHGLTNLHSIDLHGNQITTIKPAALNGLSKLQKIDLSFNLIATIDPNTFQGLSNLQKINLDYNLITFIKPTTFHGLSNLQKINLGSNKITSIKPTTFHGLSNLNSIWLDNNKISTIEPLTFHGLVNLQYISLGRNKIKSIDPSNFHGLFNLYSIWLSENQITFVDLVTFHGLNKLQMISLSNNQITSIDSCTFRGLSNLQEIGLARNQITSLDPTTFQGLSNLKEINLSYNQLASLNENLFANLHKLKKIEMQQNKFKHNDLNLILEPNVEYVSFLNYDCNNNIRLIRNKRSVSYGGDDKFVKKISITPSLEENEKRDEWPRTIDIDESEGNRIFGNKYKELNEKLGEGAFGQVMKAESICRPVKFFAIKKLKTPIKPEIRNQFLDCSEFREAKLLYGLSSAESVNIVQYEDCFFDTYNCFYLVSEFCEGGNLRGKLNEKKTSRMNFSNELITLWSKEIILGLDFLHSRGIIHRDIKPENIFLKENHIKLGDLGEAKNYLHSVVGTLRGTPMYWSPEMIEFEEFPDVDITPKTDIWSAGIIIYELITLEFPFEYKSKPIRHSIKNDPVPLLSEDKPKHFQLLINMMLHKSSETRTGSSELKNAFDSLAIMARFE